MPAAPSHACLASRQCKLAVRLVQAQGSHAIAQPRRAKFHQLSAKARPALAVTGHAAAEARAVLVDEVAAVKCDGRR